MIHVRTNHIQRKSLRDSYRSPKIYQPEESEFPELFNTALRRRFGNFSLAKIGLQGKTRSVRKTLQKMRVKS